MTPQTTSPLTRGVTGTKWQMFAKSSVTSGSTRQAAPWGTGWQEVGDGLLCAVPHGATLRSRGRARTFGLGLGRTHVLAWRGSKPPLLGSGLPLPVTLGLAGAGGFLETGLLLTAHPASWTFTELRLEVLRLQDRLSLSLCCPT